jgi:SagB-type dehydrogenase family enzyme
MNRSAWERLLVMLVVVCGAVAMMGHALWRRETSSPLALSLWVYAVAGVLLVPVAQGCWRAAEAHRRGTAWAGGRLTGPTRREVVVSGLAVAGGYAAGRLLPRRGAELSQDVSGDLGQAYHEWSKPGRAAALAAGWGARPEPYKTYAGAARTSLPDPTDAGGTSLMDAIERRRSVRDYATVPVSLADLSTLLHGAQGITDKRMALRAAPSAGALYPLEVYVSAQNVADLEPGIYHYDVRGHALELVRGDDAGSAVARAGLSQTFLEQAGACFVLSGVFQRARWKYRERTYRYVMMEAGHVNENLYLIATALGLGACVVGAFYDEQLNELLGLDGESEAALSILSVGRR